MRYNIIFAVPRDHWRYR